MSDNSVRARMRRHAEWVVAEIEDVLGAIERDADEVFDGSARQVAGRVRDRIGQVRHEVEEIYDEAPAWDRDDEG